MNQWHNYHSNKQQQLLKPSYTLNFAVNYLLQKKNPLSNYTAYDLGSGIGIDTLYMLKNGMQVTSIDIDPTVGAAIKQQVQQLKLPDNFVKWQFRELSFEKLSLQPTQIINACFSLPFCKPTYFSSCWSTIKDSLSSGGIFCGHLFGANDDWKYNPDMTFHSREQISELLQGFDIILLDEEEYDKDDITGNSKHWHVFHIVATKH